METDHRKLRRRDAIAAAGGLGVGLTGLRLFTAGGADPAEAGTCVLTPEATEGPYDGAGGSRSRLKIERRSGARGYIGTATLGVAT